MTVPVGESDKAKTSPRMRPEIIPNQPDRCLHGGSGDRFRLLGFSVQRPFDIGQGERQPQHMRGRLGEPFTLPPFKRTFLLLRKLRKLRKPLRCIVVESNEQPQQAAAAVEFRQSENAQENILNIGVDLLRVVIQPKPLRLIRP